MANVKNYSLKSLKELLEDFYIDSISKELSVTTESVEYISNINIKVAGEDFLTFCQKKGKSKKSIFRIAEKRLQKYLKTFSASKNEDVTSFLHNLCIDFQKRNKTRTYLLITDDSQIVGYFSLSLKPVICLEAINRKTKKYSNCNSFTIDEKQVDVIETYLIGQIGRNDSFTSSDINLEIFLSIIFDLIRKSQEIVGGAIILVEVDNEPKLVTKYEEHGFNLFQEDSNSELSQLLQLSIEY